MRIFRKSGSDRLLYLAVTQDTFDRIFAIELGQLFLEDQFVRVLTFDEDSEVITQWIPD
jgi:hypothetical protein